MVATQHERELQKQWLEQKLAGEKSKMDVVAKVREGKGDFVLLDARGRAAWEEAHIPGSQPMPIQEAATLANALDPEREHVVYCWNVT